MLLTVANADHKASSTAASFPQKLSMVLRSDILSIASGNAALAVIYGPIFTRKGELLRERFRDCRFEFIVGFDTLERVFTERYYDDMQQDLDQFFFRDRSTIVCARRPGLRGRDEEADLMQRAIVHRYRDSITLIDVEEAANISSTDVRRAVVEGDKRVLEEALVPAVRSYIESEGLYR